MSVFFEALILGILYGLGPCLIFCLPILTPLVMATARTGKEGIIQTFLFGFGRISTYIFLGGISGYTGYLLGELISQKVLGIFLIFFGIFILAGYFLKLNPWPKFSRCSFFLANKGMELSYFTGLVIGLSPCPPLLALLAMAVLEKSPLIGTGMGLFFGLGSLVTPLIIFGFLAGKLSSLKEFKTIVPITSGLFLILFGSIKILFYS